MLSVYHTHTQIIGLEETSGGNEYVHGRDCSDGFTEVYLQTHQVV